MKRIFRCILLALCITAIFLFSGCYAAYEKTYLTLSDVNGRGTRRIDCFFIADGFVHPDSPMGGTHNNDTYFPNGISEAVSWLQAKVDSEIFTVSLNDTEDGFHVVSVEFYFDNLDDYNQKISLLNSYGSNYSGEISPAKMTVSVEGNNYVVLWQEDAAVAHKATAWMYHALINEGSDSGIFNGGDTTYKENATRAAGNQQDTLVLSGDTVYSVTLGDSTSVFNVREKVYAIGKFAYDGSFSGTLADSLPQNTSISAPTDALTSTQTDSDGKTVFTVALISVILCLLLVGFAALYISVRKSKMK